MKKILSVLAVLTIGLVPVATLIAEQSISPVRKSYNTPLPSAATIRNGVYVNNFDDIIASTDAKTALKSYLLNVKVNDLTFYMGSLLNSSENRSLMRSYMSTLTTAGFTRRASNVTQPSGCIYPLKVGTEAYYNAGCSSNSEKFNGFTQEWEFWHDNPYGTFDTFKVKDDSILAYCTANSMYYDIYVARCRDYTGANTEAQVAAQMIKHETIYLVDYVSTTKYNTYKGLSDGIKTQLNIIGAAARTAGKVQKVCILWASEGNDGANMEVFFANNPKLIQAYNGFIAAYNGWSSPYKSSLNIIGQKIYATTGLM